MIISVRLCSSRFVYNVFSPSDAHHQSISSSHTQYSRVPFSPFIPSNMVLQNGYVTGSVFGPDWKHVQEWPQAGPSRLQGEHEETGDGQEDEYEEEEEEVRSGSREVSN